MVPEVATSIYPSHLSRAIDTGVGLLRARSHKDQGRGSVSQSLLSVFSLHTYHPSPGLSFCTKLLPSLSWLRLGLRYAWLIHTLGRSRSNSSRFKIPLLLSDFGRGRRGFAMCKHFFQSSLALSVDLHVSCLCHGCGDGKPP